MAKNSFGDDSSQTAANYVNAKGINELFEAMMTALMIRKPDDHINFIRECLDKVDNHQTHVDWDFFLTMNQSRHKLLPPIESIKPIIFILSCGSMQLCSRLLERYQYLKYLSINDIANIDDDEPIDLTEHEYRYDCIKNAINQCRSQANGFLIIGELNEVKYLSEWDEKLDRIDLVIILCSDRYQNLTNENFPVIQMNSNNDFEDILSSTIDYFDELFPQDAFISQRSPIISIKTKFFNNPIIFCIDNHQKSIQQNNLSIDEEFEMSDDNNEDNYSNSFISTLCQRLGEDFSYKHINYEDFNKNYEELKNEIMNSMNTSLGYIIDHFPTSFNDLKRFQSEIGLCSVLIYIGDYRTMNKSDELNDIIKKFKQDQKAIYVDCRMEVDEIYDELKSEIINHL